MSNISKQMKKFIFKNGDTYIGEFMNDKFHGIGILYYPGGTIKYMGDFMNNNFHGQGTLSHSNGNTKYK
tara:strand:- start:1054 stop:1260 length:207 start_codon:yes stop_codon:yes gene_type:complete